MANRKSKFAGSVRDQGGFVALPWRVIDSASYRSLSMHARALLIDIARQMQGNNNGALLCSRTYMAARGWKSADMLTKAKRELLAAKLIHETVMGQRPNKASWYAVTWHALAKLEGMDPGTAALFRRGSYCEMALVKTPPLFRPTVQKAAA